MISLRELQTSFVAALRSPHDDAVIEHIAAGRIESARLVGIYRNNLREGFLKTLDATFPIIRALGGEAWFRQTGLAYLDTHPSTSGNLHHIGAAFACFLSRRLSQTQFSYFVDVAKLEWAYQECLVAADHAGFDMNSLAAVAPGEYGSLCFFPHPAARLVRSTYPLLTIWKAHRSGGESESTQVDLSEGSCNLLLSRRDDHVELREVDDATAIVFEAISSGQTLSEVTASLADQAPECDLARALQSLFKLNILVDFKKVSS